MISRCAFSARAALLFATCLLLAGAGPKAFAQSQTQYGEGFEATGSDFTERFFRLSLVNQTSRQAPALPRSISAFANVYTWPGFTPRVTFLGGRLYEFDRANRFLRELEAASEADLSETGRRLVNPQFERMGLFRGYEVWQLRFTVQYSEDLPRAESGDSSQLPEQRKYVISRFDWKIEVRPATAAPAAAAPRPNPWSLDTLRALAANGAMLESLIPAKEPEWPGAASAEQWVSRLNAAAWKMPLARIRTSHEGLHKILPSDLEKLGIAPGGVDPAALRLLSGAREIPLIVVPGEGGGGLKWKALLFYSPAVDFIHRPHRAFWLVSEPAEAGRPAPRRIAPTPWPEGEAPPAPGITLALRRRSFFEFRDYHHEMPPQASHGRWSWIQVPPEEFRELTVEIPPRGRAAEGARLTLEMGGIWRQFVYKFKTYWNNTEIGEFSISPRRTVVSKFDLPAETFREGTNTLGVEFLEVSRDGFPARAHLTALDLEWTSELGSADNTAPCQVDDLSSTQSLTACGPWMRLIPGGGAPGDVFVVRVKNGEAEAWLDVREAKDASGADAWLAFDPAAGAREYWIATLETARRPYEITRRSALRLATRERTADYIALTTGELAPAAERLMELKRRQGLNVLMADVEDVYDAFGYGEKSAAAIQNFLRYAYSCWPNPKPFYLCLIGETSDYLADALGVPPHIQRDLVPNSEWGNPQATARGDYPYSYLSGDDKIGDIAIGRISVADEKELNGALDKIIAYQESPPPGAWRARHLLFTDDELEFREIAENILADSYTSSTLPLRVYLNEYPYQPYFRNVERRTSAEATDLVKRNLGAGVVTAVYFGHGGLNIMSSEKILHLSDIPTLPEGSAPTFLGSASCHTAWLDYPITPWKASLGELIVKTPARGAIGMFGPVAGASSHMHEILFRHWYRGISRSRLARTGDVTLNAQNQFFFSRRTSYVPDQYVLIGDPALIMPRPVSAGLDLELSTSRLIRGVGETIAVRGRTPNVKYGWADLALRDPAGRPVAPDQTVRVFNNEFQADFDVEALDTLGTLFMRVDATNRELGAWDMGLTSLEVVEAALDVSLAADPAMDSPGAAGRPFTLKARVAQTSAAALPELEVRILKAGTAEPLKTAAIPLTPGTEWTESFAQMATRDGAVYEILVGRESRGAFTTLARHRLIVPPSQDAPLPFGVNFSATRAIPSTGGGTRVTVELVNPPGGRTLDSSVFFQGRILPRGEGDAPAYSGVSSAGNLAEGEKKTLAFEFEPLLEMDSLVSMELAARDQSTTPTWGDGDLGRARLVARMEPGLNLRVIPETVFLSKNVTVVNEAVYIRGEVENNGSEPARDILVEAFWDTPFDAAKQVTSKPQQPDVVIRELLPGQRRLVRVRLDTPMFRAGGQVHLTANSRKKLPETIWDDNYSRSYLTIRNEPNLKILAVDPPTSPVLARPGEPMELYFEVQNTDTWNRLAAPSEYRVETRAPGKDWEAVTPLIPLRAIGGGRKTRVAVQFIPKGGETEARVFINAERFFAETNKDDNTLVYPVLSLMEPQWMPAAGAPGKRQWRLSGAFGRMVYYQAAIRPTGVIEYALPRDHNYPPQYLANPARFEGIEERKTGQPQVEGAWNLFPTSFSCLPDSRPPDAFFRVAPPDESETDIYDVYLRMPRIRRMFDGRPNGKILARFGPEMEFRLFDSLDSPSEFLYAGRYRMGIQGIEVVFRKPEDMSHASVFYVDVNPCMGRILTPAIQFDAAARPFRLEIQGERPPDTRIQILGRWGRIEQGEVQWDEWRPWAELAEGAAGAGEGASSERIEPRKDHFAQMEIRLFAAIGATPRLDDVLLIED